jgi:hypothetical protein
MLRSGHVPSRYRLLTFLAVTSDGAAPTRLERERLCSVAHLVGPPPCTERQRLAGERTRADHSGNCSDDPEEKSAMSSKPSHPTGAAVNVDGRSSPVA